MHNKRISGLWPIAVAVLSIGLTAGVRAADSEGQYSIRGAGLINCALFVEARVAKDDSYLVIAGWVDGYVTGINEYAQGTYDVLSFENTELLMALVDQHCQDNPDDPVFGVLNSLFRSLWPDRLNAKSEKQAITVGEREGRHYIELIRRAQQKLRDGGFYSGEISGEFSPETAEAIKQYQASIDFSPTGFPDQTTLWRLMRSE